MPSAISPPKAVLGIDVGKPSHWACLVTREGEVALNRRVRNSEGDLDGLFSQVARDTIVVVDQCRNIGLPAISRARLAGLGVAYLPGLAAHQAARLFAGDAKTDECVLSSSRRQNRRYDFDTFGVSRADLFFYSRDLPSISAFSILLLAPPNSTSLPWCMMRSMMAEASLSSPNTTPHLLNSIFVVITRLRFS